MGKTRFLGKIRTYKTFKNIILKMDSPGRGAPPHQPGGVYPPQRRRISRGGVTPPRRRRIRPFQAGGGIPPSPPHQIRPGYTYPAAVRGHGGLSDSSQWVAAASYFMALTRVERCSEWVLMLAGVRRFEESLLPCIEILFLFQNR